MTKLEEYIKNETIDLVIWDFDGVIFDLDWYYQNSPSEFLEQLYFKIASIDESIINDKIEFISRKFPYPELNEVGVRFGREVQSEVKSLYLNKEMAAVDRAIPHEEIIDFINRLNKPQVVWSNNYSNTIIYLLEKAGIDKKIKFFTSLDKVLLSKPDCEGFNLIQSKYPNIKKENILLIGDSLVSDKVAAENCGIKFFHYKKS